MAASDDMHKMECSFESRLKIILAEKRYADVSFLVGDDEEKAKEFSAHRLILAIRSPVFEAMFFGDHWIESNVDEQQPIRIPDLTPFAFQELLTYCYETETNRSNRWKTIEEACDLYIAASKYLLTELKQDCERFLQSSITSGAASACSILKFADQYGIEDWKDQCFVELAKQAATWIGTFSTFGFWELSAHYLEQILRHMPVHAFDQYNGITKRNRRFVCGFCGATFFESDVKETALFAALLRWAKNKCISEKLSASADNMRKVLGRNLFSINYLGMSSEEFINGPGASNIFTGEEKFAIISNILRNNYCQLPASLKEMPRDLETFKEIRKILQCTRCKQNECSRRNYQSPKPAVCQLNGRVPLKITKSAV